MVQSSRPNIVHIGGVHGRLNITSDLLMASITAPNIETQQVVTGISYFLTIAESDSGTGITRVEIGPYFFEGTSERIKYPEAPTNELVPAGFSQIHWVQDPDGSSWLRFDGGTLRASDGEQVFHFTSNFPPSNEGLAKLRIRRGSRSETFEVNVPDYSNTPPKRNARRDSTGLGKYYRKWLKV